MGRKAGNMILMGLNCLAPILIQAMCLGEVWAAAPGDKMFKFPGEVPPRNDIILENLVPIPMRDGVILYADIYRPVGGGKYPVLVCQTPYGTESDASAYSSYSTAVYFARRGYVFVYQDMRGRYESEGKWEPFRNDMDDGYDTIEWAAKQSWSNGKVGMEGGSYMGSVQWRAAMALPPSLVTIFPKVASTSPYHDWITLNGGWRLAWNIDWGAVRQESRIQQNSAPHSMQGGPANISYDKVLWHLPLNTMQALLGRNAQFYKDWLAHPDYDGYWKAINVEEAFDQIGLPVHTFGGWFDLFCQGTLRGYEGISHKGKTAVARDKSNIVIGPWGYRVSRRVGDIDFGPDASVDTQALEIRWFDYWLKGIDNGLAKEPPVKLFVMGRNKWRFENQYPLARTRYTRMYFSSGGNANSDRGDGHLSWALPASDSPPDHYAYDPRNPVSSLAAIQEQGSVQSRHDVLIYTSDVLDQEVEVTGPVKVVLFALSDAVDTDFVARLMDVYPDEHIYSMAAGILRARYRDGLGNPRLLEPGKVFRMEIDLVGTSVAFQKGHRIRVQLTSSEFPQFNRNLNNGESFSTSVNMKIAEQTIYHTLSLPSHVLLPIIPADGR